MKSIEQTTCMVLGGKGFVGSAVVAEARRRGYQVTVVDLEEYDFAVGGSCDILVNANGNSRKYLAEEDPKREFDLSVRSVMRSLHDFQALRYVQLSSIDAYSNMYDPAVNAETARIDTGSLSPYGFHKYLAEGLVRYYAKRWVIFRMGGFVGPGLRKNAIYDLLRGKPLRVHPDSAYQYLHTRDLAGIVFDLLERGVERELLNVAGAGTISVRSVAAMIPGTDLSSIPEDLPCERKEVNIENIEQYRPMPKTADTVRRFVQDVLAGREKLG